MIDKNEHIEVLRTIKLELRQEILEAFGSRTTRELAQITGLHINDISELRSDRKLNRFAVDRLLLVLIAMGLRPVIEMRKIAAAAE